MPQTQTHTCLIGFGDARVWPVSRHLFKLCEYGPETQWEFLPLLFQRESSQAQLFCVVYQLHLKTSHTFNHKLKTSYDSLPYVECWNYGKTLPL